MGIMAGWKIGQATSLPFRSACFSANSLSFELKDALHFLWCINDHFRTKEPIKRSEFIKMYHDVI